MAAGFLPFLLDEKGRKNQGRHQRPDALGGRPSAMSAGPTHPTRVRVVEPTLGGHSSHVMPTLACAVAWHLWLRSAGALPLGVIAGEDPRSPARQGETFP